MRTAVIKGWEDYIFYEDGRCFSKKKNKFIGISKKTTPKGYKTLSIKNNKGELPGTNLFHRLIVMAFLNLTITQMNGFDVHHKDRNRTNNKLENLELQTPKKNRGASSKYRDNSKRRKPQYGDKLPKDFWTTTTKKWKKIPGTNNFWCSDDGVFVNKKTNKYVLGTQKEGTNYFDMILREKGKTVLRKDKHILLFLTFKGEIPNKHQIHHKDHNPLNNNIENLECITTEQHNKLTGKYRKNKIKNNEILLLFQKGDTPDQIAKKYNKTGTWARSRLKEVLGEKEYNIKITKDIKLFLNDIILDYTNGMTKQQIEKKYHTSFRTIQKYITTKELELFTQISKNNRKLKKQQENLTK